jgi:hypothetical protein
MTFPFCLFLAILTDELFPISLLSTDQEFGLILAFPKAHQDKLILNQTRRFVMRMFQSERRLSKELTRILTSAEANMELAERQAQQDEADFLVYLPSDLEIRESSFSFIKVRDGGELVLNI